jgi:chromosomal replication initiator protein
VEIGGYFGGRDHTTVLHAVRTITRDVAAEKEIAEQVQHIENQLS